MRPDGPDEAACNRSYDRTWNGLRSVAAACGRGPNGYGRQMVEAGEARLREKGGVKVRLLVRGTNTKVVATYEHLGFEVAPRTIMTK